MAEHFRFFDSTDPSNPDRTYNAQEFTDYFKALVTTGVMQGVHNELRVTTMGSNMQTVVDTGIAFIEGRYYENDSVLALTHDTEVLGINRIDRVVIRLDLSPENRHVKAFIKKGSPSENPIPPVLTRDETTYEISLAQVFIEGGQTYIDANSIMDERGTLTICPWAGSNILPNFDDADLENLVEKVNNAVLTDYRTEIWVHADNGNDSTGDGTKEYPYATIGKALEAIQKVHFGEIIINIHPGTYEAPSMDLLSGHIGGTIQLKSKHFDTGNEDEKIIIQNALHIVYGNTNFELRHLDIRPDFAGMEAIRIRKYSGNVDLVSLKVDTVNNSQIGTDLGSAITVSGNAFVNLNYCTFSNCNRAISASNGAMVNDNNTQGENNEVCYYVNDAIVMRPAEPNIQGTVIDDINGSGQIFTS